MIPIPRMLLGALLCTLLGSAHAAPTTTDGLTVADPWARATPPGVTTGAVYFRVTVASGRDRLVAVSSPVAQRAGLHRTLREDGQRRMESVPGVTVTAQEPLHFAPGGYHVMLLGLEDALTAGDRFTLTLTFEEAGRVRVQVPVRPLTYEGPAAGD